jgi:hypothetical protein
MLNNIIEDGRILGIWKTARVVFLSKPGKNPLQPSAYTQISILPVLSIMWENIFKKLIERCIGMNLFNNNQFGFRRKCSIIDADCRVMRIANTRKKKNLVCILVTIDITNAYNSIKWSKILKEVKERKVPDKLTKRLCN